MEYNTQRKTLIFPEYGRNITQLVEYAKTVESREERTKVAEAIVNAMAAVCPKVRESAHWRLRLWTHLMIMSDWNLDVEVPQEVVRLESVRYLPEKVPYTEKAIEYRHYGRFLPALIEAAKHVEDAEEKKELTELTANMMKRLYLLWNNDTVSDELITDQLSRLSHGELTLDEAFQYQSSNSLLSDMPKDGSARKKKKKNK